MCRRGTIWIATVATAMIASSGATLAHADPAEEYRRLVGLYRSGDRDAARGLLQAGIPPAGFTCRGGEECEAAAVLNLDAAALLLASTRKEEAWKLVEATLRLVSRGSTSFAFDWHMAAGFLQQVSWDHSRAFDRYTAALELRPGHPEALLARATALEFSAIRDGFGGALVGGRNMWRFLGTGTSPSLADSGSQDPQRRRLLEVLTVHYRELVRLDRGQAEVRLRLGRVLEERGRHEEAAAELRPAATATDDPFVAAVARLCLARGERTPEAAAVAYRSALDVDSSLSQAWLGLSDALRTGGDREGALAALERGLAPEKPRTLDAWVLYHLGRGRAFPSALARLRTRLTRPN